MKKTVERFNIEIAPTQKVSVPFNAEILNFDVLNGKPGFNALVIDGESSQARSLLVFALGKEIPPHLNKTKFIGTFQLRDRQKESGHNVFFVFEE